MQKFHNFQSSMPFTYPSITTMMVNFINIMRPFRKDSKQNWVNLLSHTWLEAKSRDFWESHVQLHFSPPPPFCYGNQSFYVYFATAILRIVAPRQPSLFWTILWSNIIWDYCDQSCHYLHLFCCWAAGLFPLHERFRKFENDRLSLNW